MNRIVIFTIALVLFATIAAIEFAPSLSDANLGLNRVISAAINDAGPTDAKDIGAETSEVFAAAAR